MSGSSPKCVVLGGVNGAGKTTSARTILADTLRVLTFVNADVIAQGLAGFDPDSAALAAGRIMLTRLHELADQRADFAFETTLSGLSYVEWLRQLRESGYGVHLYYFWLASADLAVARVAERVRAGGHGIPEEVIRRRYSRSVQNFVRLYRPVVTSWRVYNNTGGEGPELVAFGGETGAETVIEEAVWARVQREAES